MKYLQFMIHLVAVRLSPRNLLMDHESRTEALSLNNVTART